MVRSAAGKVMWVGRATVFLVGLAVIIALTVGVVSQASAQNKPSQNVFILGATNTVNAMSSLVGSVANSAMLLVDNNGGGPALDLQVEPGQAPMKVDSDTKVANLNADKLDGQDASSFAPQAVEPWHEINTPGEPEFKNGWGNRSPDRLSTAAFYKDPYGVVHLKGVVSGGNKLNVMFSLPCGYGPAKEEWHVTYIRAAHNNQPYAGRAEIRPTLCDDGSYGANVVPNSDVDATFIPFTLDGVSFRAAGA